VALVSLTGNPILDHIEERMGLLRPDSPFYHVNVAYLRRDIKELVSGPERIRLLSKLDAIVNSFTVKEPA
jgi:hypothetical protein